MVKEGSITSVRSLLEDAKKTNFSDERRRKDFETKHEKRLCREVSARNREDVLHEVAEKPTSFAGYREFMVWVVKSHPQLLEIKARGGFTPLHLAISKKNHAFVELVLEHAERATALLCQQTDLSISCLHSAIEHKSPLTEWIIEKAKEASETTATNNGASVAGSNMLGYTSDASSVFIVKSTDQHRNFGGMTPLHMAVTAFNYDDDDEDTNDEYYEDEDDSENHWKDREEENEPQKGIDTALESDKASPLRGSLARHEQSHLHSNEGDATQQPNISFLRRNSTMRISQQAATRIETEMARADSPVRRIPFNIMNIVKKLINANDRVLVDYKDSRHHTPFQARLFKSQEMEKQQMDKDGELTSPAERENNRRSFVESDDILRYMREYIIDNFSRDDAMKALYELGDERVLEFDLSGLPRSEINAEFLDGLAKVLRFEGLLKYVALPRLAFEDDEGLLLAENTADESGNSPSLHYAGGTKASRGKGLQHMCAIFRWLKKCHVKGVLKVTVVDHVDPSHSDEAIETCIDQLDVRIWNWYKVDLSCDVITKKAPNVRDITLYSSGSNAVLMGWSSPEGLAQLEKLQRVRIYVQEGLENQRRVEQNMNKFKEALKQRRPSLKDITWDFHKPDTNRSSVFTARGASRAIESKWMQFMESFAEFLKRARPDTRIPPVKIAIIDDGIDTSLDDFTDKIQVGESFCRLGELSGRTGAYYVPSGPHGTLMAQLICRVCPVVKLYIAQLEVLPGQHGQRSFTTESATEALNWAVRQNVDIISMSWSISGGRSSIADLENTIKAADRARIAMFCASIDEGVTTDNTYPGKERSCIKIGACTGTGARLSWVSDKNSDYLLPGEAPRLATDTRTDPSTWDSHNHIGSFGSSVSTALAAGLAGVLLYCDRLVSANSVPSSYGAETKLDRNPSLLRGAFNYLSSGSESNKFPRMWVYLTENVNDLEWNSKALEEQTKETKRRLGEFMKVVKGQP